MPAQAKTGRTLSPKAQENARLRARAKELADAELAKRNRAVKLKEKLEKPSRPPGRPPLEIDDSLLLAAGRIRCTIEEAAIICRCGVSTIETGKNKDGIPYKEIIERGRLSGNTSLRRVYFNLAMNGDREALEKLLGIKKELELTGGLPLQVPNITVVVVAPPATANSEPGSDVPPIITVSAIEPQSEEEHKEELAIV